jgi:hypothetical protein
MEMQIVRVWQGGALQAAEMPPVPGEGELREEGVMARNELDITEAFVWCVMFSPRIGKRERSFGCSLFLYSL